MKRVVGGMKRVERVSYTGMVAEGDSTVGGGHTDDVS